MELFCRVTKTCEYGRQRWIVGAKGGLESYAISLWTSLWPAHKKLELDLYLIFFSPTNLQILKEMFQTQVSASEVVLWMIRLDSTGAILINGNWRIVAPYRQYYMFFNLRHSELFEWWRHHCKCRIYELTWRRTFCYNGDDYSERCSTFLGKDLERFSTRLSC